MPLTKKQVKEILELFKQVDVKKLQIDSVSEDKQKWFRFGSHNGISIASEIIKKIEEPSEKTVKTS